MWILPSRDEKVHTSTTLNGHVSVGGVFDDITGCDIASVWTEVVGVTLSTRLFFDLRRDVGFPVLAEFLRLPGPLRAPVHSELESPHFVGNRKVQVLSGKEEVVKIVIMG